MSENLAPSWRWLFGPEHPEPSRIVLRFAEPCEDPRVTVPDTLDYDTMSPAPGGLLCPLIFGPPWRGAGTRHDDHLGQARDTVDRAPRGESGFAPHNPYAWFGRIDLPAPVLHPLLMSGGGLEDLADAIGVGHAQLKRLLAGDLEWTPSGGLQLAGFAPGALHGAAAVAAIGAATNVPTPFVLSSIPVLPAGLRGLMPDGERVLTHDLNALYAAVVRRTQRLARLQELSAPPIILGNEARLLQTAVDALFITGEQETEDGTEQRMSLLQATAPGDSLASLIQWMDILVRDDPRWLDFGAPLPGAVYVAARCLEAMGLEVDLLDPDSIGADAVTQRRIRRDIRARCLDDKIVAAVGEPMGVRHWDDEASPHIDVYVFEPSGESDHWRLLTAGCSEATIGGERYELYCELVDGDIETAQTVAIELHRLARIYHNRGQLAPGNSADAYLKIVPHQRITAWLMGACSTPWAGDFLRRFSRRVQLLTVLGIDASELEALQVAPQETYQAIRARAGDTTRLRGDAR